MVGIFSMILGMYPVHRTLILQTTIPSAKITSTIDISEFRAAQSITTLMNSRFIVVMALNSSRIPDSLNA